jgi:hypothetical protein
MNFVLFILAGGGTIMPFGAGVAIAVTIAIVLLVVFLKKRK